MAEASKRTKDPTEELTEAAVAVGHVLNSLWEFRDSRGDGDGVALLLDEEEAASVQGALTRWRDASEAAMQWAAAPLPPLPDRVGPYEVRRTRHGIQICRGMTAQTFATSQEVYELIAALKAIHPYVGRAS